MRKLHILIAAVVLALCLIPAGSISMETGRSQESIAPQANRQQPPSRELIALGALDTLPMVEASAELPGWNPALWRSQVSTGSRVRYRNVYPGVDLVYAGDENKLEAVFIVTPGANPANIALVFPAVKSFTSDPYSNMLVSGEPLSFGLRQPEVLQRIGQRTVHVEARFRELERSTLGFAVDDYDSAHPLVIRFQIVFADDGEALVVDRRGNIGVVARRSLINPDTPLAALAPTVTAIKTDMLFTDNDSDMQADPGDTLKYTVVINASGMDAMGVMFSDMVDANTTFVAGAVKTSPIAFNDTYTASGNIGISVNAMNGVLANDVDPDNAMPPLNAGLTVTQVQGMAGNVGMSTATTATGIGGVTGFVTLNSNGSFSYEPPPGYSGNDTFTYTISDGDFSDMATVTITISGMIWFINNNAGGSLNRGTFTHPFTSIASFNTINGGAPPNAQPGHFIALRRGTGTYSEADGINLQDDQKLIGEAVQFNTVFTADANSIAGYQTFAAGTMTAPTITTTMGHGVDLASNNTVRGFNVGNTPSFFGFNGTTVGSPTINTVSKTGTGGAINVVGNGTFGSNVTFDTLESTSSPGANINLVSVTGTLGVTSGGTGLSGSAAMSAAININGESVSLTYPGNVTKANAGSLVSVTNGHTGTLTFNTGTVSATMGDGLQFNNADGTYNFNGTTTLNGGDAGIDIIGGSSGTFSFGTSATITSPTGTAFNVSGGSPSVTYSGSITQNTSGQRVVNIQGTASNTVAFNTGTITGGASSTGVHIGDTTAVNGNVNFSNGLTLGTSGSRMTNQAVTISGGTGTYSLGAVSIFTNNVSGIVATNADGTLNSTSGTVDSSNATAINIDGPAGLTTLGMTLTRVDSAGGTANGISIQDTDGSFTVNGDGTNMSVGGNSSGGTISGKSGSDGSTTSGIGVYLDNVTNITLRRMTINGTNQNYGIRGYRVNTFTLEYATVGGTNGTAASLAAPENAGEGSIYFGNVEGSGSSKNGLTGSATVTNCSISGGRARNFSSITTSGTLNRLTITGTTFGLNQNFVDANDSLTVEARNSGTTVNVTVTGSTFTGAPGDLVEFVGQTGTTMDVIFGGVTATPGTSPGNALSNSHAQNIIGGGGMTLATHGTMSFHVQGNTFRDADGSAITLQKASAGTLLSGFFNNNTIGVNGVVGSGSKSGNGIFCSYAGTGTASVTITNNTIRRINGNGHIYADNTGGSYTANFTIQGNLLDQPGATEAFAIGMTNGSPMSGDTVNVCADIGGSTAGEKNTINFSPTLGIVVGSSGANGGHTFNLPGLSMSTEAAVESFLTTNNTGSFTVDAYADAPATFAAFTGVGTSCSTPSSADVPENLSVRNASNQTTTLGEVKNGGISATDVNGQRASSSIVGDQPSLNLSASALVDSASGQASRSPEGAALNSPGQCPGNDDPNTIQAPPGRNTSVPSHPALSGLVGTRPVRSDNLQVVEGLGNPAQRQTKVRRTRRNRMPVATEDFPVRPVRASVSGRPPTGVVSDPVILPLLARPSQSSLRQAQPRRGNLPPSSLRVEPSKPTVTRRPASTTVRTSLAPDVNVNIGTLPAGKSVTITFRATVAAIPTAAQVCNQGTVSGSNFSNVLTDDPDVGGANDPTCTPLDLQADVEIISKTGAPDPVIAGTNITYTIQFRNNGPNTATNVTVTDTVPMNTTFVSAMVTSGSGWMRSDSVMVGGTGNIVFAKPTVANGETAEFQITVKVVSSAAHGSMISNTATADSNLSDPTPANDSKTATTTVNRQVDLVVSKMESADPVVAGSGANNLTYTVKVMNNGPSDASGVTLSEVLTLPPGVSPGPITPSMGTSFSAPTWTVGTLPAGAMATLTVMLTAGPSAAAGTDTICDTATVTASNEMRTNTGDDADTECTSVTRQVNLVVSKMESAATVTAGSGAGNLTYTITVTNTGPSDASGVVLSEDLTLPTGVTVDSITPSVGMFTTMTAPDGTWTVGNLATGAMATLTVVLTVGPSSASGTDVVCNTATVTAANETLIATGDDADSECTSVQRQVDLVVTKTESAMTVTAGSGTGNLTYTITVKNNGPSEASGVSLSEVLTLPPGVMVDSITPSQGSFSSPTWTVGNLAKGAMETLTVVLTVSPSAATGTDTICDTATVTASNETRINTGDDSDTECTSVTRSADLVVTKTESADPVAAGSNGGMNNLTYTITVKNNGPSDASGIVLSEDLTLPAGVTVSSITPSMGTNFMNTVAPDGTWTVGNLASGAMATLTVVLNVSAATADGAMIANTATITAVNEPDPGPGANSATETTTVQRVAELELTKTESLDPVIAGSNGGVNNLTYTIKVTNNGPSPATGVVVTETLVMPAGVTLSSATPSKGSYVTATGVWTIGNLAVGEMATLTIVLNVSATAANGAMILNTAAITAVNEADPNTMNNSRTENTTIQRQADLAMTKTDSTDPIRVGAMLTYTLKVTNGTLSEATGVTVSDTLTGSVFNSVTTTQGTCAFNQPTKTLTCQLGTMAVSAMATITLKVIVVQIGVITNTATVVANEVDPGPGNNSDAEMTTVKVPTELPGMATVAVAAPEEITSEGSDDDQLQQLRAQAVLIADFANDQVRMLVSQSNGTFRQRATMLVGDGPTAIALGDVNGDGVSDAVVVNELSNNVSILLGNGDGTFQRQRLVTVGLRPTAVAIGDFNGDSRPDLAVANFDENTVLILLGQGDGRFQTGRRVTVGTGPTGVAVGDFNRDGRSDLAVCSFISNEVTVLRGRGDGTFENRGAVLIQGDGPMDVAAVDLNEDGQLELVTVNFTSGDVTVLKPDDNRVGFRVDKRVAVGTGPVSLVAARLLTGQPGLAAANLISAEVTVQPGDGGGEFGRRQTYTTVAAPIALTLGDFNGDGLVDLAVLDADGQTVRVLFDDGAGKFKLGR